MSSSSLSPSSTSSIHSYGTSSDELTSSSSQVFQFQAAPVPNLESWHSNETPRLNESNQCISSAKYSATDIQKDLSSPSEVCLDRAKKLRRSEEPSSRAFTADQKVQSAPILAPPESIHSKSSTNKQEKINTANTKCTHITEVPNAAQYGSKSIPTRPIYGAT